MGLDYGQYGMDGLGATSSASGFAGVWVLVSLILSLIGCFIVYFAFVNKDKKEENKTLAWLKDFLRFDKMLIEPIMKIAYIFLALLITLSSFAFIGQSFITFLMYLVFGNLLARVAYEAAMMMVMIWKNTTEINKKLK